jgi:hypothetical protein
VPFDASAALWPDHRGMPRPGRQHEATAGSQRDWRLVVTHKEGDGARRAHEELGVAVNVRRVAVAGTVRPGDRIDAGLLQEASDRLHCRLDPLRQSERLNDRRCPWPHLSRESRDGDHLTAISDRFVNVDPLACETAIM